MSVFNSIIRALVLDDEGHTSHISFFSPRQQNRCCVDGGGSDDTSAGDDSPSGAMTGVDVSSAVSTSTASCFKSSGVNLIIPRAFHSTGTIDTAACTTLENAKSGLLALVFFFFFWIPFSFVSFLSSLILGWATFSFSLDTLLLVLTLPFFCHLQPRGSRCGMCTCSLAPPARAPRPPKSPPWSPTSRALAAARGAERSGEWSKWSEDRVGGRKIW